MSVDVYRQTRIMVYGDSQSVGHNVGDPLIVAWQKDLNDKLTQRYGADRPILINNGTNGFAFAQLHSNFATKVTPHTCDLLIVAGGSLDFGTGTGPLTTDINNLITDIQTAANWRLGKVPRQVLFMGAMTSSGVVGEDWSADSSAFITRNAIIQTRALANGYSYADPLSHWQNIEKTGKPQTLYGTFVDKNNVTTTYPISTLSPINPKHTATITDGTGYANDGTHPTINGSRVWGARALEQMILHDTYEPGA